MKVNFKLLMISIYYKFLFLFIVIFFIFNFTTLSFALMPPKNSKLIFSYVDPANDDYGPGTYTYPTGDVFKANPHMFDLRKIEIYEVGNFYRFDIEYKGKIIKSWPGYVSYRNGWIFNIAEIYIDIDNKWGSGHKKAILGRNLVFKPESYWDKVVFISPVANDIMINEIRAKTDDLEFAESLKDFVFPSNISIYDYTLSALVNKSAIGEYNGKWGIQVLSTVFDNFSSSTTFYNKRIYKSSTDFEFGGASDLFGAPNVLDIITPPNVSQKDVLSKYHVHPNPYYAEFAVVPMVYINNNLNQDDVLKNTIAKVDNINKNQDLKLDDDKNLVIEKELSNYNLPQTLKNNENKVNTDNKNNISEKQNIEKKFENNIDGKNTNKSKTSLKNKKEKDSKSKQYDSFIEKLENQKLKLEEDESKALDDVEKFLAANEKPKVYSKTNSKDFNDEIYEIANYDKNNKNKLRTKNNKELNNNIKDEKEKNNFKQNKNLTKKDSEEINYKPLVENEETQDKSIIGRLFKKKKNTAKANDKELIEIAKNELPNNQIRNRNLNNKNESNELKEIEVTDLKCMENMKKIYDACVKYLEKNPNVTKISMNMLISAGLLKEPLRCESGGRYLIEIKDLKPKITCINVNNTGHGTYISK